MKTSIALLSLSVALASACTFEKKPALPDKWKKEFSIRAYSGGGMRNETTHVEITYDSCRYTHRTGDEKEVIAFPMTEASRTTLLEKMHELRLDKIRTSDTDVTYDKESTSICYFDHEKDNCSEEGATSEIHEDDEANFFSAYQYLVDFGKQR